MRSIGLAALSALLLLGCQSPEDRERLDFADRIKAGLETELPDYPSTRFRNVHFSSEPGHMCGELNAMTPNGGYSGWVPFLAVGGEVIVQWDDEVSDYACPGEGYDMKDESALLSPG